MSQNYNVNTLTEARRYLRAIRGNNQRPRVFYSEIDGIPIYRYTAETYEERNAAETFRLRLEDFMYEDNTFRFVPTVDLPSSLLGSLVLLEVEI